jgi:outer membrane protein assembly factor BamA
MMRPTHQRHRPSITTPGLSLIVTLWLALFSSQVLAVPISEIRFEGNAVTREKVLRQELLLQEGDELDINKLEASRQAIMNLGLFKEVGSRVEEDGASRRLVFTMEERYYLLPIPIISGNQEEGNYSYGVEVRHDNVMGLNQRLKLTYENEQSIDGTVPSKRQLAFTYSIPRLINTPFQLSLDAKRISEQVIELDDTNASTTGGYYQDVSSGGFFLSRWVKPKWISQGWTVGAGLSVVEKSYHQQTGSGLEYDDSQSLAVNTGINYNEVEEHQYHRAGTVYGYSLSIAQPWLNSDYNFTRHWLYYRRYQPLKSVDANVNSQFRLGLANARAFDSPTYSIGSSSLLRGYENGYAEGDAMMILNVEYHHHLSGYRQLRGVLFTDVGNAWESPLDIDLGDMPAAVGVGLRWRVQAFVNVTLRMDYARALQDDNSTLTLTTSASF